MKKLLLTLSFILLMTPVIFASQTYVIGEMFTQTWCGFCPAARSALNQMASNTEQFPYLIPIIWQGNGPHISPNYGTRQNLYGFTGIPHARFCGDRAVPGGGANVYNNYVNAYNQTVNRNAPMEITVRVEINAQNELVVSADVFMTGNIATPSNNIIFVLTYDLTGVMDPDYFASAKTYHSQAFPLTTAGQQETFVRNHAIDPTWDMTRVTAVVFVQSLNSTNPIIHQAGMRSFQGLISMFSSNVQQGPPTLHVQFYNNSIPSHLIDSWEWDLNGDGEIDSYEENPSFIYDEPGTYTVTLKISDGVDVGELKMEDYITVLDPANVHGYISGFFSHEFAPYVITGDVTVPPDGFLEIEPGLEIKVEGSSISVKGPFKADALGEEPIIFTSDSNWKGLRIENSDHPNKVTNCVFNKATETALRVINSNIEIIGNTFHHNTATGNNAGALKIVGSNQTVLKNNIIANNHSATGVGGIEIEASSFNITNNLIVNNTGQSAAALFIKLGTSTDLINNTISHNSYNAPTGFHILNSSSYVQIKNSIIWGEGTMISDLGGAITIAEFSNISGGYDGLYIMDTDPLFEEPAAGYGSGYDGLNANWVLSDDSPCIDAGNATPMFNDPEDPDNPGYARYPAKGTIRNDLGVYGGNGTSFWVSVEDDYTLITPEEKVVLTAYPNPFNPEITISLSNIPYNNKMPLTLKVFNTKGQLVKTLAENEITDQQLFRWNGTDNNGTVAPSGVYLINFTTDSHHLNRRVILLK